MQIQQFTEIRVEALKKWKEYKEAEKVSKNPIYKDMRKIYNQIKSGRKIIDIFSAIQKGGIHENYHPKLAIAKANVKTVYCMYNMEGHVNYLNQDRRWSVPIAEDVSLKSCLPAIPKTQFKDQFSNNFRLIAPVPLIPAKFLPKVLTDDYYILWEVDEWKMVPPTDPWLLKRITKTHFVVLAGWDLTELEKSVMRGHMY